MSVVQLLLMCTDDLLSYCLNKNLFLHVVCSVSVLKCDACIAKFLICGLLFCVVISVHLSMTTYHVQHNNSVICQ